MRKVFPSADEKLFIKTAGSVENSEKDGFEFEAEEDEEEEDVDVDNI